MTQLALGLYQHYKGNFYRVIGMGRHTETGEELVIYQSLYGDCGLWVRPLKIFLETIVMDGQALPRFKFIKSSFEEAPISR